MNQCNRKQILATRYSRLATSIKVEISSVVGITLYLLSPQKEIYLIFRIWQEFYVIGTPASFLFNHELHE
jgi:hypothetical protein